MNLEYFSMVDRIAALDVGKGTITVEAQVPKTSTIFEGHFPGYPLMPGVLLIEAMAQSSGWLVIALQKFERIWTQKSHLNNSSLKLFRLRLKQAQK